MTDCALACDPIQLSVCPTDRGCLSAIVSYSQPLQLHNH